jgi:hypothetical protein
VRNSKLATNTLRFFEGLFSDKDYSRGRTAKLARRIPLYRDSIDGNMRTLRRLPGLILFSYAWNKLAWNTALPMKSYLLYLAFVGVTISGPWATVSRIMNKLGIRPGAKPLSMIAYAVVGSFATCTTGLPLGILQDDAFRGMDAVTDGVHRLKVTAVEGIRSCAAALTRER